jgi:tetratricopeptide (TPR) repeat protein
MVTTFESNGSFERSKQYFKDGEIKKAIDIYEKAISFIDREKESAENLNFLKNILEHCRKNNLIEEEALALRALGRTYSVYKKYVESLRYHWASLKLQRKLGKKVEVAEGLRFIAEDLEVSGEYDECLKTYNEAIEIFRDLGKLKEVKKIKKEVSRLKEISKEILEDEYLLNKFHIDSF